MSWGWQRILREEEEETQATTRRRKRHKNLGGGGRRRRFPYQDQASNRIHSLGLYGKRRSFITTMAPLHPPMSSSSRNFHVCNDYDGSDREDENDEIASSPIRYSFIQGQNQRIYTRRKRRRRRQQRIVEGGECGSSLLDHLGFSFISNLPGHRTSFSIASFFWKIYLLLQCLQCQSQPLQQIRRQYSSMFVSAAGHQEEYHYGGHRNLRQQQIRRRRRQLLGQQYHQQQSSSTGVFTPQVVGGTATSRNEYPYFSEYTLYVYSLSPQISSLFGVGNEESIYYMPWLLTFILFYFVLRSFQSKNSHAHLHITHIQPHTNASNYNHTPSHMIP